MTAFAVMAGGFSYAAEFTDLKGYDWAKDYIYDVNGKGIVSGYPDSTFKPGNPVTRIETIVMVSNLSPKSEIDRIFAEKGAAYEQDMVKMHIDKWARPYIVYAFETGILPKGNGKVSDVFDTYFMDHKKTGKPFNALRYEVAVFLVRALGIEGEMKPGAALTYKDNAKIPSEAVSFIYLLQQKGVLSDKGDGKGYYNPKKSITRAETATMLSKAYQFSSKAKAEQPKAPDTSNTVPNNPGNIDINGEIALITFEDSGNMIISIKQSNGTTSNFSGDKNIVKVYEGAKEVSYTSLEIGQNVKLNLVGDKIAKIIMPEKFEELSGTIEDLDTSEKTVTFKIDDKQVKYSYTDNTEFKLNGTKTRAGDIAKDTQAKFKIDGSKLITELDAKLETRDISGEFVSLDGKELKFRDKDDKTQTAKINDDTKLYINEKRTDDFGKIKQGAKIKGTLENGIFVKIEVTSDEGKFLSSTIDGINESRSKNTITFTDADGASHTAEVNSETIVRINGEKFGLGSLNIGYKADIYVKDGIAEEIATDASYNSTSFDGKVEKVDRNGKYIQVKKDNEVVIVSITDDTVIKDVKNERNINVSDIYKGDKVTVIGTKAGGDISAKWIVVEMVK